MQRASAHVNNHTQVNFATAKAHSYPVGKRGSIGSYNTLVGIIAGHISVSEYAGVIVLLQLSTAGACSELDRAMESVADVRGWKSND